MKRNKKGFTLVELVIVIAVIAILAGVMIAVFSGVVRRANENAELQQVKNDELKQKAEDVLTKLDNANWFSWEDFENSLAAKLTEAYKNSTTAQLTTEQIQDAVKKALEDYAKNNATENSQLTEAQVKVIIENAISEAKLGGVTEAQVRTIVNTAVGSINTVSKADIQRIVDAATSKGLTAEQVAKVINDAGLATNAQLANVSAKVDDAITAINALKPVTKKDVSDAIIDLVPVTYTINTAEDLADALARVKSFSTLNFTSEYTVPTGGVVITLPESDDRVLIIKGVELSQLTVNAPGATVYLATDAGNVLVTATAGNSFHVVKNVETLTVNKGRVVVEDNAVVDELKAAPSLKATVKVVIEEEGTVKNLNAEYQKNGDNTNDWIEVENNGTVVEAQLTLTSTPTGEQVTTNVKVTNGENAKGTSASGEDIIKVDTAVPEVIVEVVDAETGTKTEAIADGSSSETVLSLSGVARIGKTCYDKFSDAWSAGKNKTIVLLQDVTLNAIPVLFTYTIDLNGHTLTVNGKNGIGDGQNCGIWIASDTTYDYYGSLSLSNGTLSLPGTGASQYGIYCYGTLSLSDMTVTSACNEAIHFEGNQWGTSNTSNLTNVTINASKNAIQINGYKGYYGSPVVPMVNIKGSTINGNNGGALSVNGSKAYVEDSTMTASSGNKAIFVYSNGTASGLTPELTLKGIVTSNASSAYNQFAKSGTPVINVQEGTYNFDPSAYVATGYTAVDNGDGTWTVSAAN